MSNQRISSRLSVTRPVIIILSSGKKTHAYIIDISDAGVSINTLVPAEVGAKLGFKFSLPIKNLMHEINLSGKISYCHIRADKYVSGVNFLGMTDEQKKLIRLFMSEVRSKRS